MCLMQVKEFAGLGGVAGLPLEIAVNSTMPAGGAKRRGVLASGVETP